MGMPSYSGSRLPILQRSEIENLEGRSFGVMNIYPAEV